MPDGWIWDSAKRRYIAPNGKIVTPAELRRIALSIAENTSIVLEELTSRFVKGSINSSEWAVAMREGVKGSHSALAQLAWGGTEQMTPAALGHLGASVKEQYGYLSSFINGIQSGSIEKTEGIISRAGMYGDSSWTTYTQATGMREILAGANEERSFLDAEADHCQECFDEAARGWVPAGEITPVGDRECLTNCRCEIEYRTTDERTSGDD